MLSDRRDTGVKFYIGCSLEMKQMVDDITKTNGYNSEVSVALQSSDIDDLVMKHINMLIEKIDTNVREGSGWYCVAVKSVDLFITR